MFVCDVTSPFSMESNLCGLRVSNVYITSMPILYFTKPCIICNNVPKYSYEIWKFLPPFLLDWQHRNMMWWQNFYLVSSSFADVNRALLHEVCVSQKYSVGTNINVIMWAYYVIFKIRSMKFGVYRIRLR